MDNQCVDLDELAIEDLEEVIARGYLLGD